MTEAKIILIASAMCMGLLIAFISIMVDLYRMNSKLQIENERLNNEVIDLCRQNNKLRMENFVKKGRDAEK